MALMLRLLAATALIIALRATSALSQDTRTDELARAQAEKADSHANVASLSSKAVEGRQAGRSVPLPGYPGIQNDPRRRRHGALH